jgi:hypothetical protein
MNLFCIIFGHFGASTDEATLRPLSSTFLFSLQSYLFGVALKGSRTTNNAVSAAVETTTP